MATTPGVETMADVRRLGGIEILLLLVVLAAAAGARTGYLWVFADRGRESGPLVVQGPPQPLDGLPASVELRGRFAPTEFDALVHNLKEHHWFGSLAPLAAAEEQTAHVAPGYPWLVGLLARAVPLDDLDYVVRWAQVLLGTLTAGLYFAFARRAFHSTLVALLAGLFCAVHPFWVISTAAIQDAVLASFLLAVCLFLGIRAVQTSGPFASLLFGFTLAGLALTRAALLPYSFVALGWFLLRSRSVSSGWLCAVLAFLGFATGLAPWTVRNYQIFKEPLPIVDSTHLHLWIGNNDLATGGPANEVMLAKADRTWQLQGIRSQPERYARLGSAWLETVRREPYPSLRRRLNAALYFFLGERWFQDQELAAWQPISNEAEPADLKLWYPLALLGSLMAMLLLALLGWRWTYGWRSEALPSALALLWIPLPYILSHAEALSGPRLPLDGVLLTYAAFALVCLLPGIGSGLLAGAEGRDGRGT